MKPRSAQRKGKQGEHELARTLTALFGVPCKRLASAYLPGWAAPDVYGLPGCHIEAKRREQVNLTAALRQAQNDARRSEVPVVCHRPNRAPWLVTLALSDLPRFIAAAATWPRNDQEPPQ